MTGMNPEYGAGYEGWPDGFAGPEAPQRPERLYRRVKGDARRALSSRWGKGAAGVLFLAGCGTVFYLLTQIIGGEMGLPARGVWLEAGTLRIDLGRLALDGLMLIPAGVLLSPLILGYLAFLYRLTSGEEASLREIFQPLQDLKLWARSVGMLVLLGGVSLLSAGVGLLPGAGLIYFTLGLPGRRSSKSPCWPSLSCCWRRGCCLRGILWSGLSRLPFSSRRGNRAGCCGRPPGRCGRRKGSAGSCLRWRSPLSPVRSCSFLSRRLCLCYRMNGPLSAFFPVSWPTACRGKRRPGTPGMQDKGINLQNI